jgi:UDP-N-acetylglucosamine 1-carboxyvinyltransferase
MDKFIISGPVKLSGKVNVSSSKNATLPILCATLLFEDQVSFKNLPKLKDVTTLIELLEDLGVRCSYDFDQTHLNAANITNFEANYELVRKMRASVLVLGPLLARFKQARVSLPGGCSIGTRPVDIHLSGLEAMGATFEIEAGYINASCDKLIGAHIVLPFASVGATENIMMAATLACGQTIIENAAREPEIEDLANFLNAHGAQISGASTSTIKILGNGGRALKAKSLTYEVIGDRIEAITFIIAALMTNSEITVENFNPQHLKAVLDLLVQMGANLVIESNAVLVKKSHLKGRVSIQTAPFPGFPTDAQAQMMALLTQISGDSVITENIFENRFMHVPELNRMGADIELKGSSAFIKGNSELNCAPVMCTDLRASAALVLAALTAKGDTEIRRVYHIDRGYSEIDLKLKQLGVQIKRLKE